MSVEKVLLKAVKWVNGGYCLAYLDEEVVFVKGMIPEEEGYCNFLRKEGGHRIFQLVEILTKTETRITSDCEVFLECGGCDFRHLDYNYELSFKKELLLKELLHKKVFGTLDEIDIPIHFDSERNYRNNVQLKIEDKKIGFYAEKSSALVPIPKEGCKNLSTPLNDYIKQIQLGNKNFPKNGKLRDTDSTIVNYSEIATKMNILGKDILVPKDGFFQVNRFLIPKWIRRISEIVEKEKPESILELFSGSGLVSVFLSEHTKKIHGMELDSSSVEYATQNAKNLQIKNISFSRKDLFQNEIYLESEFIFCNPPRAGLGKKLISSILKHKPSSILISSCNYITLALDLQKLKDNYRITQMELFDFFPRTSFFETLVMLKLR
ncbi:MAG: methyltransferase [Leptospiraceae bacterium]|nr:methyltransferase [Leptospiraceae bacterium]